MLKVDKNKLGHFLVLKDWKKSWVELETTFITNRQAEIMELASKQGVDRY